MPRGKMMRRQGTERVKDAGFEDGSDKVTSEGMPATSRSCRRQGMVSSPELCQHTDFSSVTDFRLLASRTVRQSISVILSY